MEWNEYKLKKEIKRLKRVIDNKVEIQILEAERDHEEIERLRKELKRYGRHDVNCTALVPQFYHPRCSCGYEQALKEEIDDNSRNSNKKTN